MQRDDCKCDVFKIAKMVKTNQDIIREQSIRNCDGVLTAMKTKNSFKKLS